MSIQAFESVRRWLTWCFLASAGIASMEAFGCFLIHGSENTLRLGEFVQLFSSTCLILLVFIAVVWVFIWFFMVWLGGVRPGLALFFMLSVFMLLGILVTSTDVTLALAPGFAPYRSLLMMDSHYFAVIGAALASLILGKIFRRSQPVARSPLAFTMLVVLLTGAAFAAWTKGAVFPQTPGVRFWGMFAAAAVAAVVLLWWLGQNPYRLGAFLVAFSVAILAPLLAPLPLMFAMRPAPEPPAQTASASTHAVKDVILITIDTLRQDALGCYNAKTSDTPRICEFARDSVQFTNAFSAAPWTYPSVTSILTGLAPHVHQLVDGRTTLPENVPTMAGYMKNAGYHTAALGFNSLLLPRSKLDRGFQEYHWFPTEVLAFDDFEVGLTRELLRMSGIHRLTTTDLTDKAIQWFADNEQRDTFFWLHYFDPHMPYAPPREFLSTDPKERARGTLFWDVKLGRGGNVARTAEERAWVRSLYDSEVRYVDTQVGRLLDSLRKRGIYDDALIVLSADHGEEFWDHDHFEHGHTLFNELIKVPFLIKLPKGHGGKTIDARVSTQAIMPTILNLCGVTPDAADTLLSPLVPLLQDAQAPYVEQPIFSGAPLFQGYAESVIFDQMKYIRLTSSGHEMLFNLRDDPRELNSLAAQDAENLAKGRQLLDASLEAAPRVAERLGIRRDKDDVLDQRDILSLQALGYL